MMNDKIISQVIKEAQGDSKYIYYLESKPKMSAESNRHCIIAQ